MVQRGGVIILSCLGSKLKEEGFPLGYHCGMGQRQRLDVIITSRGLAPSRTRAQALVMAGKVTVDGAVVSKAGTPVQPDARIEVAEPDHPWVSRGALKLVAALDTFEIDPQGLDCLDVGASTGGFTHVLLERGAQRVVALDVGHNQLDWRIRCDERVVVMEGVNARRLGDDGLPFRVQLVTLDVSFISLRLVVPAILPHLEQAGWLISLVKPQFEAGRHEVGKGGIVRDEKVRRRVIDDVVASLELLGLQKTGVIPSPIAGQKGNREELAVFRKGVNTE
jgi:23S rRNA (cytidine1920-2'-O)/16S rRNA (cytidine1409-2'-O)-methyltransferase